MSKSTEKLQLIILKKIFQFFILNEAHFPKYYKISMKIKNYNFKMSLEFYYHKIILKSHFGFKNPFSKIAFYSKNSNRNKFFLVKQKNHNSIPENFVLWPKYYYEGHIPCLTMARKVSLEKCAPFMGEGIEEEIQEERSE